MSWLAPARPAAPAVATSARQRLEDRASSFAERIETTNSQLADITRQLRMPANASAPRQKALRDRAGTLLKRRQLYEQQRQQREQHLLQLERQSLVAESFEDTATTAAAMRAGHTAMVAQKRSIDVDKLGETLDDMGELMRDHDTLQSTFANAIALGDDSQFDDATIDAELEALVGPAPPGYDTATPPLPEVPATAVPLAKRTPSQREVLPPM